MSESNMMKIIRNRPIIKRSQLRQRQVLRISESRFHIMNPLFISNHSSSPHQFDLFVEFAKKEPPVTGVKEALSIDVWA